MIVFFTIFVFLEKNIFISVNMWIKCIYFKNKNIYFRIQGNTKLYKPKTTSLYISINTKLFRHKIHQIPWQAKDSVPGWNTAVPAGLRETQTPRPTACLLPPHQTQRIPTCPQSMQ